jgi:hypothetical protein
VLGSDRCVALSCVSRQCEELLLWLRTFPDDKEFAAAHQVKIQAIAIWISGAGARDSENRVVMVTDHESQHLFSNRGIVTRRSLILVLPPMRGVVWHGRWR